MKRAQPLVVLAALFQWNVFGYHVDNVSAAAHLVNNVFRNMMFQNTIESMRLKLRGLRNTGWAPVESFGQVEYKGNASQELSNWLTIFFMTSPSARPLNSGTTCFMTLPMSLGLCAPDSAMISWIRERSSSSPTCSGR